MTLRSTSYNRGTSFGVNSSFLKHFTIRTSSGVEGIACTVADTDLCAGGCARRSEQFCQQITGSIAIVTIPSARSCGTRPSPRGRGTGLRRSATRSDGSLRAGGIARRPLPSSRCRQRIFRICAAGISLNVNEMATIQRPARHRSGTEQVLVEADAS